MNLANQLSVLRVGLAPLFVICLYYFNPQRPFLLTAATAIFVVACLTDALDGWLARRLDQRTVVGSYIDPLADKLLLTSGFLSLSFIEHLPASIRVPAWVTIPVLARDALILGGAGLIYITTGRLDARPLKTSKATTFAQMVTLLAALLALPDAVRLPLCLVTVALTVISGALYVRVAGRILQ